MQNRPLLRELFPEIVAMPVERTVSSVAAEPMNITLRPLKDDEYWQRIKKAGWKQGIPQKFIDPIFKTIIDNDRFNQWLSRVEREWSPDYISARRRSAKLHQAFVSCIKGVSQLEMQEQAQPVAMTMPVAIATIVLVASVEAEIKNNLDLLKRVRDHHIGEIPELFFHKVNSYTCSSPSHLSFLSSRELSPARSRDSDGSLDLSIDSDNFADTNGLLKNMQKK